jgi:general secretion pathway protein G
MNDKGFTLIELLITLAILAVFSTLVIPLAQVNAQRTKEQELRLALRTIRTGIDTYKKASDEGRIRKEIGASGYPKSLDELVEGIDDQRDPKRKKLYFLRKVPRDPFEPDAGLADVDTWLKRAYASDPQDPQEGDDVYDVRSRSRIIGLNGIALNRW